MKLITKQIIKVHIDIYLEHCPGLYLYHRRYMSAYPSLFINSVYVFSIHFT